MNSHASSSCLLAVIAIFVTVTVVSGRHIVSPTAIIAGRHIVSPPAIIVGHKANSLVVCNDNVCNDVDNGSSTTEKAIITTPSTSIDTAGYDKCCDPNHYKDKNSLDRALCEKCRTMCNFGITDARHNSHLLRNKCRCFPVAKCLNITDIDLHHGTNRALNNVDIQDNAPEVYGMIAMLAWYQRTFLVLSITSCLIMLITAFVYFFSESREHSRYVKNVMMSITLSTYIALVAEQIRQSSTTDFQSTGIYKLLIIFNAHGWQLMTNIELSNILKYMGNVSKFNRMISRRSAFQKFSWFIQLINISITFYYIDIFHQVDESIISLFHGLDILGVNISFKPSILIGLIPGLVNIIVYVYLFKYNKIQLSSIHPDLLNFYGKRISTRNKMFKISILMFIVDFLYILDIKMGWNFTGIQILRLLKPCQGILISYVFLFRPFAPVLFNKLLIRLRRREGSANEVTVNPIYAITTV